MTPSREFEEWLDRSANLGRAKRTIITVVAMTTFTIVSVLGVVGSVWLDRVAGFPRFLPSPLNIILSLPIIVAGFALMLWCVYRFAVGRGTPVPFNPPRMLVTTGPYAYVRHPMVVGWFMAILGVGLFYTSVTIAFVVMPLAILLWSWEIRAIEEPQLERRFGQAYVEYKERVPRFVPRVGKGGASNGKTASGSAPHN